MRHIHDFFMEALILAIVMLTGIGDNQIVTVLDTIPIEATSPTEIKEVQVLAQSETEIVVHDIQNDCSQRDLENAAINLIQNNNNNQIILETNKRRLEKNLPPLAVNFKLAAAAEIKVNDMFTNQYFAHESPTGVNLGDLANQVGYEFWSVGENLAMGNYTNDQQIVTAWMDSPGHRENILNPKYTQIGVAVKRDLYAGQNILMAAQEFGWPMSDCD